MKNLAVLLLILSTLSLQASEYHGESVGGELLFTEVDKGIISESRVLRMRVVCLSENKNKKCINYKTILKLGDHEEEYLNHEYSSNESYTLKEAKETQLKNILEEISDFGQFPDDSFYLVNKVFEKYKNPIKAISLSIIAGTIDMLKSPIVIPATALKILKLREIANQNFNFLFDSNQKGNTKKIANEKNYSTNYAQEMRHAFEDAMYFNLL